MFNILISGGCDNKIRNTKNVNQLNATNFSYVKALSPMIDSRRFFQTVCLKGEVYVFGGIGCNENVIRSVLKYSPATNAWIKVADMLDGRHFYSGCAFMDEIFIFGGCEGTLWHLEAYSSCLQFDTKGYKWKEVAEMNEARIDAACVVFEERILISGGWDISLNRLNTVESYDVLSNTCTQMPNMIERRRGHRLIVVKNKLFVFGGCTTVTCEVFDNNSKTFVAFNSPSIIGYNKSLSIGSKIIIFQTRKEDNSSILSYDVHENKWSDELCEVTKNLTHYSCVMIPSY